MCRHKKRNRIKIPAETSSVADRATNYWQIKNMQNICLHAIVCQRMSIHYAAKIETQKWIERFTSHSTEKWNSFGAARTTLPADQAQEQYGSGTAPGQPCHVWLRPGTERNPVLLAGSTRASSKSSMEREDRTNWIDSYDATAPADSSIVFVRSFVIDHKANFIPLNVSVSWSPYSLSFTGISTDCITYRCRIEIRICNASDISRNRTVAN